MDLNLTSFECRTCYVVLSKRRVGETLIFVLNAFLISFSSKNRWRIQFQAARSTVRRASVLFNSYVVVSYLLELVDPNHLDCPGKEARLRIGKI